VRVGSGWSTAVARLYMASVLVGYLLWYDRKHRTELLRTPVDIDLPRIRRLITLGCPLLSNSHSKAASLRSSTALIARLGAVPACQPPDCADTVAFTYMVPLGIASAAAVRVGQAIGPPRPPRRRRGRWHCHLLGAAS